MKTQLSSFRITIGKQYFISTIILLLFITILFYIQDSIGYQTVSLILLLVIFLLPFLNFERGPIILSALISAFAWDYYFIPPHFTLHIDRAEDVMMLFMFFIVAVTNSILTTRLKVQKNLMVEKERRSNALYNLIKELSIGKGHDEVLIKAVQQIKMVFGFESVVFFSVDQNRLRRDAHPASNFIPDEMEWLAAESSYITKTVTGKTTDTLPGAYAKYFPLNKNDSVFCVLGVKINDDLKSDPEEMKFLSQYIKEISTFLERDSN